MEVQHLMIENIPAILIGSNSDSIYFFVHGKSGCKEEAEDFAKLVCQKGGQVLSIDLPEHGERKDSDKKFVPWEIVPELTAVMKYLKEGWKHIAIRANSIGAWFCMLAFGEEPLDNSLFVSPVLDMERLICDMMSWASVTEKMLAKEKEIGTNFGETLSWRYYEYAKEHPILRWQSSTKILYAGRDNLTQRDTAEGFAGKFHCKLTVMDNGEHWFHTQEQLHFLNDWEADNV